MENSIKLKPYTRTAEIIMKEMKLTIALIYTAMLLAQRAYEQQPRIPTFKSVSSQKSNVVFANMLKESPVLNIITYEYYYNGGGVGVGDFNNDGLADIYFTANMQTPRLYLNKGNMEFQDITAKAGVQGKRTGWHTGVSIADVNGDGFLDIYVCYSGPVEPNKRANELFINNGDLTFTEKARDMGIADVGYSTQAVFFDYDRDNDLDIFVINHNNKNLRNFDASIMKRMIDADAGDRLYRNDGQKFTDVTTAAGMISNPLGYGLGVSVSDINNDGWPDIYVTNDYVEEDYLYINNHDGSFSEKLKEQIGHISNFSMGCDIADINNDGWADVFTLDMLPADNHRQKLLYMPDNYELYNNTVQNGFHHQLMRNMLQLNNGNGTFSEVGQFSGVYCTDWSWASLFADLNNDGNKDLFITNGYGRDMTNRDFVKFYANERLKYLKGEPSENMFRMLQSIPVTPLKNYMFLNNGDTRFTDISNVAGLAVEGISNGAAYADLDNDGDLDLIVNHLNSQAEILQNMLVEEGAASDWIAFQLKGTGKNVFGLGAVVTVYTSGKMIRLENAPVHGFQSSMHVPLHTGLPGGKIDSVIICWPDGKKQTASDLKTRSVNTITYRPDGIYTQPKAPESVFRNANPLAFKHEEAETNDYKVQPLMPNMISYTGPRMAKGDVNKDGLPDIFICGSKGHPGKLFIQKADGSFAEDLQPAFAEDAASDDADAVFFDADGDGSIDLYVVSGGYNVSEDAPELQDRLYLNAGGRFRKFNELIPQEKLSGACVAAGDIDGDGDTDVFVGSRVIPGKYPEAPESLLMLNTGKSKMKKVESKLLQDAGMITDALIKDLDGDGKQELIICGQWNGIRVFSFRKGELTEVTGKFFDKPLNGWWNRLHLADVDGDKDPDLVAGNWGLNNSMNVSDSTPAVIYYGDFDNNGSVDPIICYYIQGKLYPMASRDEITDQMVSLRQKFPTYDSYSNTVIEDILSPEQLKAAKTLQVNEFRTLYFENVKGKFRLKELPVEANYFPVYAITSGDFDHDGKIDLLLGGNTDHARIKIGRIDAGFGTLLKGDGKGNFEYVPQIKSGLSVKGCIRDIIDIEVKNTSQVLISVNQEPLSAYSY